MANGIRWVQYLVSHVLQAFGGFPIQEAISVSGLSPHWLSWTQLQYHDIWLVHINAIGWVDSLAEISVSPWIDHQKHDVWYMNQPQPTLVSLSTVSWCFSYQIP